jgi:putative ABC transport system substrate-binding protein
MNRRYALAVLGGILMLVQTRPTKGQAASKTRRIGVLHSDVRLDDESYKADMEPLWARLADFGWIEGKNLLVVRRSGLGDNELLGRCARELVRLNVELILTTGVRPTVAAKEATTTIPIVMLGGDPVAGGIVASLARPGANITGFSNSPIEVQAKELALLREMLPDLERVAVIFDPTNVHWKTLRKDVQRIYESQSVQPLFVEAASGQIESAVLEAKRQRAQALMAINEGLWGTNQELLVRAAQTHSLPLFANSCVWVQSGALLSFEGDPDDSESFRAIAYLINKILRGANPADLPFQQPTKFSLCINQKTATFLGLAVPKSLLLRADRVIQ